MTHTLEKVEPHDYVESMSNRAQAHKRLMSLGHKVSTVWRVVSAGDSDVVMGGRNVEYVLYLDKEERPMTAYLLSATNISVAEGW